MSPGKDRTTALDDAREKQDMAVKVIVNIRISTVKNVVRKEFK
jgi:hypothetical protein